MENLFLAATPYSPEIDFRFDEDMLSLKGESYPENAAAFYAPVLMRLRDYLALGSGRRVIVNVALAYFNSSSTKMLFNFFEALNEAAQNGNKIVLNWYRDEEDETILEFGQDLIADFPLLEFHDHPIGAV